MGRWRPRRSSRAPGRQRVPRRSALLAALLLPLSIAPRAQADHTCSHACSQAATAMGLAGATTCCGIAAGYCESITTSCTSIYCYMNFADGLTGQVAGWFQCKLESDCPGTNDWDCCSGGCSPPIPGAMGYASTVCCSGEETCDPGDSDQGGNSDEGCSCSPEDPGCCDSSTGRPVNLTSGVVTVGPEVDLSVAAPAGVGIELVRGHVSRAAPGRGALGTAWSHGYETRIYDSLRDPGAIGAGFVLASHPALAPYLGAYRPVVWRREDGRSIGFQLAASGGGYETWQPEPGFPLSLRRADASGEWELAEPDGTLRRFDASGRLLRKQDRNAAGVTLVWDASNRLISVTDDFGNQITLSYGGVDARLLSSVQLTGTPYSWSYAYDSSLRLTRVTYPDGGFRTYVYDSDHVQHNAACQPTVTRPANRILFVYDEAGMVQEAHGYELEGPSCHPGAANHWHRAATTQSASENQAFRWGVDCDPATPGSGETAILDLSLVTAASCATDASCPAGSLCFADASGARCVAAECLAWNAANANSPTARDGTARQWDASLNLACETDATGVRTSHAYDAAGRRVRTVENDSDCDAINADPPGSRWEERDWHPTLEDRVVEVRRASALSPGGEQVTSWTYDGAGSPATRVDAGFTRDSSGALAAYAYTTTFSHDALGRLTRIEGPRPGQRTDYSYFPVGSGFSSGRLQSVTRWTNGARTLTRAIGDYDAFGNARSETDEGGHTRQFEYDARGRQTSVRSVGPADLVTTSVLLPNGLVDREILPGGSCILYSYDAFGRVVARERSDDCDPASPGIVELFSRDAAGRVLRVDAIAEDGATITRTRSREYGPRGRPTALRDSATPGAARVLVYDARGLPTDVYDELGNRVQLLFDAFGRFSAVRRYTSPASYLEVSYLYDAHGNTSAFVDEAGLTSSYEYDDLGRLVSVTSPDSGVARYAYDEAGNLLSATIGAGSADARTASFTHDLAGRLLAVDYGGDTCGADGRPGQDRRFDYDDAAVCPVGVECQNSLGRVVRAGSETGCSAGASMFLDAYRSYDAHGRLVRETLRADGAAGDLGVTTYAWSADSDLVALGYPSGRLVSFDRGSALSNSDTSLVTGLRWTPPGGGTPALLAGEVSHRPFGPWDRAVLAAQLAGAPLEASRSFGGNDRLASAQVGTAAAPNALFGLLYEYDAAMRVTERQHASGARDALAAENFYAYDALGRLVCHSSDPDPACLVSSSGGVERRGSRLTYGAGSGRASLEVTDALAGGATYSYAYAPGTHRLASAEKPGGFAVAYAYDATGSLVSIDDSEFSGDEQLLAYHPSGQLRSVSGFLPGAASVTAVPAFLAYELTNLYDHRSRRIAKRVSRSGGATSEWSFFYDDFDRLISYRYVPDTSNPAAAHVHDLAYLDGELFAEFHETPAGFEIRRYLHTDGLGTVLTTSSAPQTVCAAPAWRSDYAAFGHADALHAPLAEQPLRFPGQFYDAETEPQVYAATSTPGVFERRTLRTGFAQNHHRDYDPFTGRYDRYDPQLLRGAPAWFATDPFAYVSANPVSRRDPSGLFEIDPSCDECRWGAGGGPASAPALAGIVMAGCVGGLPALADSDTGLAECVMRECGNARIRCEDCRNQRTLGYINGTRDASGRVIPLDPFTQLCRNNAGGLPAGFTIGDVAVHEFAHRCGWFDGCESGVPLCNPH